MLRHYTDSKTERSVASWRERRGDQSVWPRMETHISISSGPLSVFLSPPFFFPLSLLSSFGAGFGSGFVFFDSFSLHLFPLAFSVSALLPWLPHHPYMKCICRGYERMESDLLQQNTSSSVQASIDEHITCRSARKNSFSVIVSAP